MNFTSEEITYIHNTVRAELRRLESEWVKKFKPREVKIINVVAEAILNLPRTPGGN